MQLAKCRASGLKANGEPWQCLMDEFHLSFHVSAGGHVHIPEGMEVRTDQAAYLTVLALRESSCVDCGHTANEHATEVDPASDRFGKLNCECKRCLLMFWASHGAVSSQMTH